MDYAEGALVRHETIPALAIAGSLPQSQQNPDGAIKGGGVIRLFAGGPQRRGSR